MSTNRGTYDFHNLPSREDYLAIKGIYGIRCVPTNKWYIGQTIDLYGRLKSHFRNLQNSKKCNKYFERAFHLYGESAFEIHILEECVNKEDLDRLEKHYMDFFKSSDKDHGYNICYFKPNLKPAYTESFHELAKKPKKFGFGDVKVMRELYREGYDNVEIRKKYGCCAAHMSSILGNHVFRDSSYKKPTAEERHPLTFEQRKAVDFAALQGKSEADISRELGINWRRLNRYYKKNSTKSVNTHETLILDTQTGIYYYNITEAADAIELPSDRLYSWLIKKPHRNKTTLVLVQKYQKVSQHRPTILDIASGIFYESFKEAARAFSVTPRTITRWLTDLPKHNKTNLILC